MSQFLTVLSLLVTGSAAAGSNTYLIGNDFATLAPDMLQAWNEAVHPEAALAVPKLMFSGDVTRAQSAGGTSGMISSRQDSYTYAPTTLLDSDGTYKMWFCGNNPNGAGDGIFYTTAPAASGPWTQPVRVLAPLPGNFDGLDVCDPSVIKSPAGLYLLYYGAADHDDAASNGGQAWTSIGLAASQDGINWSRVITPDGHTKEIVVPINPNDPSYGAGQPAVIFDETTFMYVMLYTDSTRGGDQLYLIRSLDPTFANGVQNLKPGIGWVPDTGTANRVALQPGADADLVVNGDHLVFAGNGGGNLILSAIAVNGQGGITQGNSGAAVVGDAAMVHTSLGDLAWQGNTFWASVTVVDPGKSAPVPWNWSIQNVSLAVP